MEQYYSAKKAALLGLAFIAVIVIVVTVTHFFVSPDNRFLNIIGYVIGGIGVLFSVFIISVLLGWLVWALVVWIKTRKAKSDAYDMIEYGRIYHPERFKKVISELERWGGREARHLLNDLYKLEYGLEQIPDKKDELDEDELFANVSIEDLLALKEKYKDNQSVVTIISDILEARAKEAEQLSMEQ